jgi:YesN/AraC family two-component response regulator
MYTIVIADDENIERTYLTNVIKKYPEQYFISGEASNGEQVIDIAMEKKPDIIIMDINMPVYDGLTAAHHIKTHLTDVIIILNSAYAEFQYARQAIDYNLDAYLLKPSSENEILDTISSCLNKKLNHRQLRGIFIDTSQNLTNGYPDLIVDHLVNGICMQDLHLIRFNLEKYMDFLSTQKNQLEKYRLYIINTVFSIERELQGIIPEKILKLLNFCQTLQNISEAKYWFEILDYTENFCQQLMLLFSENMFVNCNLSDKLVKYIDENFNKQISLDGLSDIFHFNPSYISRTFHMCKGITLNNYIMEKRINHAIYLLSESGLQVKEISCRCGFINITHFNRVFKKMTGKTPLQIKMEKTKNEY